MFRTKLDLGAICVWRPLGRGEGFHYDVLGPYLVAHFGR